MFYTYVLRSKKDGKWYTGSTNDLRKRFNEHNDGKVFSTKGRGPFETIYYEACQNEQDARAREKYLKSGMGKRYLKNRLKRFLSRWKQGFQRDLSLTGFTFIELMLGLLIFSIIALSLYSTFSAATSAWRKSEDSNRIYREAKWALDEIAKSLRNAASYDFRNSYPDLKLFEGTESKLSFLAADKSGLKRISFFLEKPDSDKVHKIILGRRGRMPDKIIADYQQIQESIFSLQRKEQDFVSSLSGKDTANQITLTSLVKQGGLKFSFAYRTTESDAPETLIWKDSFESPDQNPRLVKITLTLLNPKNLKQEKTFTKIVFIPTGELPASE